MSNALPFSSTKLVRQSIPSTCKLGNQMAHAGRRPAAASSTRSALKKPVSYAGQAILALTGILATTAKVSAFALRPDSPAPAPLADQDDFVARTAAAAGFLFPSNSLPAFASGSNGNDASIESDPAAPGPSVQSCKTGVVARPSVDDDIPSQKAALATFWNSVSYFLP